MTSKSEIIEKITELEQSQPTTTLLYLIRKRNTEDEKKLFNPSVITIDGKPVDFHWKSLKTKLLHTKQNRDNEGMSQVTEVTTTNKDGILKDFLSTGWEEISEILESSGLG